MADNVPTPGTEFNFTPEQLAEIHAKYDALARDQGLDPIFLAKVNYLNGLGLSQQAIAGRLGTYLTKVNRYILALRRAADPVKDNLWTWAAILLIAGIIIMSPKEKTGHE